MLFKNHRQLLSNARNPAIRSDALKILEHTIASANPVEAVRRNVTLDENRLTICKDEYSLDSFSRIFVIGGGKASGKMAEALENILGKHVTKGAVIVLDGTQQEYNLSKISIHGGHHPVPDGKNVDSTQKMLEIIDDISEKDLVFVLISGGGSALMTLPLEEIPLGDIQNVTTRLLHSGATINEINAVRKHLSQIKGGLLAKRLYPATVISLILSDVIGDSLDVIASGPTVADSTTYQDALDILSKYDISISSILSLIKRGVKGSIPETPKHGQPELERVKNHIIGNVKQACEAAKLKADSLGYKFQVINSELQGIACEKGVEIARLALQVSRGSKEPQALILGGETTVHVTGDGMGGRNLELALCTVEYLSGVDAVLVTMASDGIDGSSSSAGAIVDGDTLNRANKLGLDPGEFLSNNDSYTFFNKLGDTLETGLTGTNVNDLVVVLIPGE